MTTSKSTEGEAKAESRVLEALAALTAGDRVYLHRKSRETLKYEYLGPMDSGEDAADFLDRVKALFGGGEYKAQAYGTRPDGSRGYLPGSAFFDIAGVPKGPGVDAPDAPASESRMERMMEGLLQTLREDRESRSDALLAMMFKQQGEMMTALAGRPAPDAPDPARFMEMFMKGVDFMRENGGGGNDEPDPYAGVAARLMDLVSTVNAGDAPAALPAPAQDTGMIDPPGAAALALRDHLPRLLQAARARIPAEQVARAVLDASPPEAVELILVDPTVVDDVIALEPAFNRWRSWLVDVLAVLDELSEGEDDGDRMDPGGGGAPGGDPDSGGNGGVPG